MLLDTTLAFVPSSCVLAAEGIVKKCNTVKKIKKKKISVSKTSSSKSIVIKEKVKRLLEHGLLISI